MESITVLAHHELVIVSMLRLEEYRINDGFSPRTPQQIAEDWYQATAKSGARHYQTAFTDIVRDKEMVAAFATAIIAYRGNTLNSVGDFSQKRDAICEACPVSTNDCWRRNDSFTVEDGIRVLRGKG